ncbi:MAG: hypothetical protein ABI656_07050, partial [bacterium]
ELGEIQESLRDPDTGDDDIGGVDMADILARLADYRQARKEKKGLLVALCRRFDCKCVLWRLQLENVPDKFKQQFNAEQAPEEQGKQHAYKNFKC